MGMNNSVTIDIKARADQASFKEVRQAFEDTLKKLGEQKSTALEAKNNKRVKELNDEIDSVQRLQQAYESAYNHKYNNLNATQFKKQLAELKVTGTKLNEIGAAFSKVGPQGVTAFKTISASVMSSNTHLQKTQTIFQDMMKTMGNTIKWGISSSLMNSFTGSVSEAYSYVKNLDKSLNDIRIVGEKSAKDMERFAISANKAAQALGSNTLDYTNASLIYYQQGLNDNQVKQMTDITVKMSNVLGTSAEEVSDYMTAIWNNFSDGSRSLEYYADVITKLGAATASSAEEISTGLEKFAAVAKTTGLSYEYATAALTTVTAKTRQSAEVVGTAFKTLFARIQDLELGNTLDDGTTLGQYSEALYKVGIDIKDSNGEMKKMDAILSEMGQKWVTLGDSEKVALAQTVAGVRQYNQLMALMDNWDEFGRNLERARNASGTLVDQQAIYMESTEAHLASAEAAWEDFKDSLLDESVINFFADLSKTVAGFGSHMLDSFGSMQMAGLLGGSALRMFSADIGKTIFNTKQNRGAGRSGEASKQAQKDEADLRQMFSEAGIQPDEGGYSDDFLRETKKNIADLNKYAGYMDEKQEESYKNLIKEKMMQQAIVDEWKQKVELVTEFFQKVGTAPKTELTNLGNTEDLTQRQKALDALLVGTLELENSLIEIEKAISKITEADFKFTTEKTDDGKVKSVSDKISKEQLAGSFNAINSSKESAFKEWSKFKGSAGKLASKDLASVIDVEALASEVNQLEKRLKASLNTTRKKNFDPKLIIEYRDKIEEFRKATSKAAEDIIEDVAEIEKTLNKDQSKAAFYAGQDVDNLNKSLKDTTEDLEKISRYDAFTSLAGGVMQTTSGLASLRNIFSILENDALSSGEKIMQMSTNVLMTVTSVVAGVKHVIDSLRDLGVVIDLNNMSISNLQALWKGSEQFKEKVIALAKANDTLTKSIKDRILGEAALQGASKGTEVATEAATTSTMTFKAALQSLGGTALIIAAIIAALVAIVYKVVEAYNKDIDAAQEAAAAAEHAKSVVEEAASAYERLSEGMANYKNGVEALKELTEGTEEYKEAIEKANKAVLDLIKADASLAPLVKKDGELYVFEDEKGNDITDEIVSVNKSRLDKKEAIANMAQVDANQKEAKYRRTDAMREAGLSKGKYIGKVAMGLGATGAAAGASGGPQMAAIGAVIMGAIGAGMGAKTALSDEQVQTILQSITDNNGHLTEGILRKLEFVNGYQIDALMEEKEALEALAESTNGLNATNRLLIEQGMRGSLENNEIITKAKTLDDDGEEVSLSDKQKNAINSLYSKGYTEEEMEKQRKKLEDEWNKDIAFGLGNEDKVHKKYKELMGYTLVDDKWGDKAVFADKNGEEITVSDDTMRAYIINAQLTEQMSNYDTAKLQKLTDATASVDTSEFDKKYGINFDEAFFDAVASGGDFDFSEMFADISPSEFEKMWNLTPEDWQAALGLTDEELDALGFGTAKKLAEKISKGLEEWKWSAEDAVNSVLKKDKNAEKLEEKGLDVEEFKDYAVYLMNTADEADDLADSLEGDADAAMTVARSIMRMNNGVEKLSDNFTEWSHVLKTSRKSSEEYHKALTGMQDAMADLLDTEDNYITDKFVQEHMEDIERAANGDAEAIDRLHKELAKDMVFNIATDNEIAKEEIDQFINTINTLDIPDLEAGVVLNGTDQFAQELVKIVQDSKMTAEQAREFFGQMGFDAKFETHKEPVKHISPRMVTNTTVDSIFPLSMTTETYQDGVHEATEWVEVPTLTTDEGKPADFTLTRRAGGSYNNGSSVNAGGAGKKGASAKEPKKEDLLKDVIDRYHDVNIELEEIGNSLSKAQKETEQLVGQDLINNLTEQYALLNKQIDTTAEKINIAKGELAELKDKLAAKGMTFSEDGSMSNYAATYQAQIDYVNGLITQYNNMSAAQQEAFQDTLDKAKEDFETFKENLERYDELLVGEIPDLEADIVDAINEQIALKLDAFHHEIEIRLNMAEAERDWNAFFNKVIKDIDDEDILGNAEAKLEDFMSYYKEEMDGIIQVNAKHINDILADLKTMDEGGIAKFYGEDGINDRARALEDLENYYKQLMEDLEAVHDLSDEIHESYVDMIEEAQEKFDEQISTFETINNLLEHDKNVISMIYGEEAYSALSQFYDRQEENYNKQLDFQKQQVEFWKQQMETAEEGSDAWNAAKENWLSAVDAWNSAIETAIENLQDKYLNAINAIFQNLNNNVTGGMGLDYVETEWDLINQNADQYLDTVNAIYQVQELQNKYLDAIDKTDSPAQQKKLNDLMQQETDYLREQDKLSEYDLERANLKYEIAMKQIALEEAQQNKTQLRLRRDSQGNYTYQYTQDDDQVASIQQEIADLYNQLYNLDADAYKDNLNELYSVWSEFQERMAEAAQINDPEQRAAKELLIKEQYSELINGLVEKNENLQANMYQSTMSHLFDLYNQNTANYEDMSAEQKEILDQFINEETDLSNAAFDNLFDLYNINIEGFKNMTDEQQDILMNSMIPQWESGVQQMADKIAGEGGFAGVCKNAFEELDQTTKDYVAGLEELQKNADVSFEEIKEGIDQVIVDTEKLLENNTALITKYTEEVDAIKGVISELEDLIAKYKEAEEAAKKAAEEAYKYKQQEDDKNANVDPILDKTEEDIPAAVTDIPTTQTNNIPLEPPKPSLSLGSYVSVKPGTRWYGDSWGGGSWGYASSGSIAYTSSGPYGYNIGGLGWVRKSDIVGYDTGGYTGDWDNNNGRLAMLHQKELVLNANDTSNMLNAITILRDITANLGATLLNKMAAISAGGASSIGQGLAAAGMEQTVTINAEFPNATSSKEIEDALNNLVNRASQHIAK